MICIISKIEGKSGGASSRKGYRWSTSLVTLQTAAHSRLLRFLSGRMHALNNALAPLNPRAPTAEAVQRACTVQMPAPYNLDSSLLPSCMVAGWVLRDTRVAEAYQTVLNSNLGAFLLLGIIGMLA